MNEQVPVDIRITDDIMALEEQLTRPTMVFVSENITDKSGSKKRAEKRKYLEKQLSGSTIRIKQMKKKQINCKFSFFLLVKKNRSKYVVYSITLRLC